jgi:hypothetical protein
MGIEDPDADVAEQHTSVLEDDAEDEEESVVESDIPVEADPADVAEQRTEVPDVDDYDRG